MRWAAVGDLVRGAFPAVASSEGFLASCLAPWDGRQRLWWLLWGQCPGVGVRRLRQLLLLPGGLEAAWGLPVEVLAARLGWPRTLGPAVDQFRCRWGRDPLDCFASAGEAGRRVLLPGDWRWPEAMESLDRPPAALYWRGRGRLWAPLAGRWAVAVVGTRRPSSHGLLMASRIGAALAAAGWPVVSGLAEGIDGAAHEGCLAAGGAPVGVLGTPLDRTYPRHHRALQQQVAHQGLLVSEWPVGAPVRPGHFASRNRLQVALARALVVVECPLASGALHSADLAWAQGLPLWVVPADAARLSALGSNRLLARGATPLLTPSDLIDQLGPGPLAGRPWPPVVKAFGDGANREMADGGRAVGPAALVAPSCGVTACGLEASGATAIGEAAQALTAAAGPAWGAKPAAAMACGESALAAGAAGEMAAAGLVVGSWAPGRRVAGPMGPMGPAALGAGATVQEDPVGGRRLLAAVGAGASLEQISQALNLPAEQLVPVLLELELAGLLRAEPGLRWRPAAALEQQGFASERGGPRSVRAK